MSEPEENYVGDVVASLPDREHTVWTARRQPDPLHVGVAGLREALAEREADCRRAEARLAVAERMREALGFGAHLFCADDRAALLALLAEWDGLSRETG